MVLLVAALLVAAAVGLLFVSREQAETYILLMLAGLAVVGVVAMFALAAGILRAGGSPKAMLRNAVSDGALDGILVTDAKGRVQYANNAYLALVGARNPQEVRPVERAFVGGRGTAATVSALSTGIGKAVAA